MDTNTKYTLLGVQLSNIFYVVVIGEGDYLLWIITKIVKTPSSFVTSSRNKKI